MWSAVKFCFACHHKWLLCSLCGTRAIIKRRGPGIFLSYYEHCSQLLSKKNKKNRTKKETPSCLIPHLLFVFTQQLEILVTTMVEPCYYRHQGSLRSMVVLSLWFLCPCGPYYLAPPTKTTILCRLTWRGHARIVPVFSGCLWKNITVTCFFNIKTKADIWMSIKELFNFLIITATSLS